MADGPWRTGWRSSQSLIDAGALADYHLLFATRADFLRRLGRPTDAADDYATAIALAGNDADRRLLRRAREAALREIP